MKDLKQTGFADRIKAAQEAKKAMAARFVRKPTVNNPELRSRAEEREAELARVRAERAAAKEAARIAKEEAERAALEARMNDQATLDQMRREERKARKAAAKAEARTKRESRKAGR
jgi:hypothetical protein